jgi:hypothetical protein
MSNKGGCEKCVAEITGVIETYIGHSRNEMECNGME